MTYKELKKLHPEMGFILIAYEDMPGGFGRKGWNLYGNCNHLIVKETKMKDENTMIVYLGIN